MQAIQYKALLVKLSLSLPGNSRKDGSITAETIQRHNLGQKAGRWLKQIFPDEAIEPLTQITGEIRTWHYEHTLPWSDEGQRLLPCAMHSEYTDEMRAFRRRYESARDTFLGNLDQWVQWAREAHNGTFDPGLYVKERLEKKFAMKVEILPVPSGDQLPWFARDDAEETNQRIEQAVQEAQADLWHRLASPLQAMVSKLSEPDRKDGKAPIFRDSLVTNIRDIVALVPKLDIGADPQLSEFAAQAKALATPSPDQLRESKTTREETAKRAADILARMAGYMPTTNNA